MENETLNNMIAVALQNAIAKLGPIPDRFGDRIKQTLKEDNILDIIQLGLMLEECVKQGNYSYLTQTDDQIYTSAYGKVVKAGIDPTHLGLKDPKEGT